MRDTGDQPTPINSFNSDATFSTEEERLTLLSDLHRSTVSASLQPEQKDPSSLTGLFNVPQVKKQLKESARTHKERLKEDVSGDVSKTDTSGRATRQDGTSGRAQLDPLAAGPDQRPAEVPSSGRFLLPSLCPGPAGEEHPGRGVGGGATSGHGGSSKETHPEHAASPEPTQHHATRPTCCST